MDKYALSSDPCDYRIIAFSNCLQILACICDILAIFIAELREVACILDRIADFVYHVVSGCMTAQVSKKSFIILLYYILICDQTFKINMYHYIS